MKFLVPIDLVQNELQNAVIQNLATAPANGKAGQLYFNTTDKLLYQHNGTAWTPVGGVYELPVATADTLGGIKVGGGLQITESGVLSATGGGVADSVEWSGVLDTPTTLAGYGIVDAKIENGTITLGTETIIPITSVNGKTGSSVTLSASDIGAQPEDFIVTITTTDGKNFVSDKTSAELNAAYEAKKNIKTNTPYGMYSITYVDSINKLYICSIISLESSGSISFTLTLDASNDTISISTSSALVLTATDTDLSIEDKAQFRSNIGAGTSDFSGSYNDLTDKPTVDTAMSADSTNAVQNKVIKAYVDGIVAASQGIVYKGVINAVDDIPTTYDIGWLYMIGTAGTYVGQKCEVGDLMIAVVARKGTGNQNSDWDIVQTNIEGAITELTGDSPISVTGTGASREIALENSGVTTGGYGDTTAQTPAFGATFKVPSFTVDQYGRLTAAGEHTVTIPATVATDTETGLMSSDDHKKLTNVVSDVATLQTKAVSTFTGTIAVGSLNVEIPLGNLVENVLSVYATNAVTGEEVVVDVVTANATVTASLASATTYAVKVVVTAV